MIGRLFRLGHRLVNFVWRGRAEREFGRELEAHLGILEDTYRGQGLEGEEARRAARRAIGGLEQIREVQRDVRSLAWMEQLIQDLRYAIGSTFRNPLFTAVIVLTLALGIGANTAIFSLINAVLLEDLAFPNADRLYMMRSVTPEGAETGQITPRDIQRLYNTDNHPTVEAAAIVFDVDAQIVDDGYQPHPTIRYGVTYQFFDVFNAPMTLGRGFERGEHVEGIVISHRVWRDYFDSAPDMIGRTIVVEGGGSRVVQGVAAAGFDFPLDAGYWSPMQIDNGPFQNLRGYEGYVRVRANRTRGQLQTDLDTLAAELDRDPLSNIPLRYVAEPLKESVIGDLDFTVAILFGATGILLLIACVNVINLLLSRGAVRAREIAMREAMGAGRWRILRQLLTESLMLAFAGGAAGLAIAAAALGLLSGLAPPELPRINEVSVNGTVFLFAIATTTAIGAIIGLAPAIRTVRIPIRALVNEGGRGVSGSPRQNRIFGALVVAEVSLAVLLVIGAGLLIRSYANLSTRDPGFNPSSIVAFTMNVGNNQISIAEASEPSDSDGTSASSYDRIETFFRILMERIEGISGIEAVATSSDLPLGPHQYDVAPLFSIAGRAQEIGEAGQEARARGVTPSFFPAMEIRILAGRNFSATDRKTAPGVTIVNETFARRFFGNENPIGERIDIPAESSQYWERIGGPFEIIGVVEDAQYRTRSGPPAASMYFTSEQLVYRRLAVLARTSVGDPASLIPAIRNELTAIDPSLTAEFSVYEEVARAWIARERFGMVMLTAFGLVALLLAATGIYGLMAYTVTKRTGEFAVRSAMGATRRQLLYLILRYGLSLSAMGVAIGMAGAAVAYRLIQSQLYGVSPLDTGVFAGSALVLTGIAALATWIPARHVARINPGDLLRGD
jgi:putative ABC transport system permease protein